MYVAVGDLKQSIVANVSTHCGSGGLKVGFEVMDNGASVSGVEIL